MEIRDMQMSDIEARSAELETAFQAGEVDKEALEAEVKALFAKAAPYFEKYRELDDKDPSRWASPLRVIYNTLGEKV